MNQSVERVPVHILTGALGSGKTTLLNDALRAGFGASTAVVVNEFGAIPLDQLFLQTQSEEAVVLHDGCICCTLRTDLVETLMALASKKDRMEKPFQRIVVETSGLSDPVPILNTINSEPQLRARFAIGSVVCTVGAIDAAIVDESVAMRQLATADAVVITKRDLADDQVNERAEQRCVSINPIAERIARNGEDLVRYFARGGNHRTTNWRSLYRCMRRVGSTRLPQVQSEVISGINPVSWSRFAVWLSRLLFVHGDRILRMKGVLFDATRDTWIAVHGVRRFLYPPVHLELEDPPPFGACLVFITENLSADAIRRSYNRMLTGTDHA